MMKHKRDMPLQIKAVTETGEFSGYGSVFDVEDSYGDIVIPGAFAKSLAEWGSKDRMPAMLWQHDTAEPIGVWTKIGEDGTGLAVEGRLLIEDDPAAKRAHAHLKAGSISGLSIGYNLVDDGYEYDSDKDVFILSELDLWEVSLVTFPANDDARVEQVKHMLAAGEIPEPSQVERLLRDAGFSRRQAKAIMADGYKGIALRDAADSLEGVKSLIHSIRSA